MKDLNLRQMLVVLPVALAIVAAVFIARVGMPDATAEAVQPTVDMSIPF